MSRVSKKEEAIKAKYEKLSQEAKPKPKYIIKWLFCPLQ